MLGVCETGLLVVRVHYQQMEPDSIEAPRTTDTPSEVHCKYPDVRCSWLDIASCPCPWGTDIVAATLGIADVAAAVAMNQQLLRRQHSTCRDSMQLSLQL